MGGPAHLDFSGLQPRATGIFKAVFLPVDPFDRSLAVQQLQPHLERELHQGRSEFENLA